MTCTSRIELFFHSTRLLGIARATRCELEVQMLEPYPGARAGSHVMYLLADKLGYLEAGRLSGYGEKRAGELLIEIYLREERASELRQLAAGKAPELEPLIQVARREVAREIAPLAPLPEAAFCQHRQALRRDLRAGLDPHVYQRRLRTLRQRREAAQRAEELVLERVATRWLDALDARPQR